MAKRVAVVGAGIAGLVCAYQLKKSGLDVTLFEKEKVPGGRMACFEKNGLSFDAGTNFFIDNYKTLQLYCKELGIEEKWQPLNHGKIFGFEGGKLHPLSLSLGKILYDLKPLPFHQRVKLVYHFYKLAFMEKNPSFYNLTNICDLDTANGYDYILEHVGKEAADHVIDSFTATYQFHGAKNISIAAMIALLHLMVVYNKEFAPYQTEGGMRQLPIALAEKLNVHFDCPVEEVLSHKDGVTVKSPHGIDHFDQVVLASTANVTKKILRDKSPEIQKFLESVAYAPTVMASFIIPREFFEEIYLVMVPFVEGGKICVYTNEGAKGSHFETKNQVVVNAALHADYAKKVLKLSDEELFSAIRKELIRVCPRLSVETPIQNHILQRWDTAMPIFDHGYLKLVKEFLEHEQGKNNIFLCGDYLNSPWTEGAAKCGERVAVALLSSHTQLPCQQMAPVR